MAERSGAESETETRVLGAARRVVPAEVDQATTVEGGRGAVGAGPVTAQPLQEPPPGPPPGPPLSPQIGRFVLLRKLGEGGMGMVFMAYDDALNRRVALKLLRAQTQDSAGLKARMQREAQALAQISHPNVVQIYDVGVHEGRVFVAMELVEGVTLKGWLRATRRSWSEVLEVLLQAGEGLAAAHQVGLIHRDIKPDNILVGDDGRVRVADFGLARSELIAADVAAAEDEAVAASGSRQMIASTSGSGLRSGVGAGVGSGAGSALSSPLTEVGTLLGTPTYMAPEQHMRRPADSRADLFAFCVVAYEALVGHRPFKGSSRLLLLRAIMAGEIQPPPRECEAPPWLLKVLHCGLAAEASQRPPTMTVLLAELRRDPSRQRRRALQGLALAGLVAGAAWAGAALRGPALGTCAEVHSDTLALWDDARRGPAEVAITGVGGALGPDTWVRVDSELGEYVRGLYRAETEVCAELRAGTIGAHIHALELECLGELAGEVDALAVLLRAADQEITERALAAVSSLPAVDTCADVARLLDRAAPPENPEVAAAVADLRGELGRIRAMRRLGSFQAAAVAASEAVRTAAEVGYPPVEAEALVEAGRVAIELGEYTRAAAELLPEALRLAELGGDDRLRLDAVSGFLAAYGATEGPPELLAFLVPQALALLEREGALGDIAHGRLLNGLGETYRQRGEDSAAAAAYEEAMAIFEARGERGGVELSEALNGLATIRSKQGRYPEAHALYTRARAALVASVGPHHPYIGHLLNNEARAWEKQGDLETAQASFSEALAVWEPVYGPNHQNLEIVTGHLARVALGRGDLAAAEAAGRRSLAIRESTEEGKVRADTALLILAQVAERRGDLREAAGYAARALAVAELRYGDSSPRLLGALRRVAILALARGDPAGAAAAAERALGLTKDSAAAARLRLLLAQAKWRGGEHAAALAVAAAARSEATPEVAAEIDGWLAERRGSR